MSAQQLEIAAELLGPMLKEVVFVGGATVYLWLTDQGSPPARATEDVDVICEVATRAEYYRLGERLRGRGFAEAPDEPVLCRWRSAEPRLTLDASYGSLAPKTVTRRGDPGPLELPGTGARLERRMGRAERDR